jgi:rod shape-determining protein MreD
VSGPWRLWGTVAALAVLHFLIHLGVGLGREAPDLLTLALLIGAREVKMGTGAVLGFAFGLMEDSFSVLSFGANTIALTLVGALGARTRDLFVGESLLFVVSYFFVGKWVRDLVLWVAVGGSLRGPFDEVMLVQASLAALYVAALGLVVLWVTGNWWESSR